MISACYCHDKTWRRSGCTPVDQSKVGELKLVSINEPPGLEAPYL